MNNSTRNLFLPTTKDDMKSRGWDQLDIIIVTGDAYVDHPSYGAAVIGRVLESHDFKVGIIAQPLWADEKAFAVLGKPRLFFGVTAGNIDSMVAHYTANKKPRAEDDYSPGAVRGRRPDRASIIYTNKIKSAFPGVSIILGGIEASLRRLAHYDYWSDTVKRSILLDAKADMLVYGMGESQIVEIAKRASRGEIVREMRGIRGTVIALSDPEESPDCISTPSFEEISCDIKSFNSAFRTIYTESDPLNGKLIQQRHGMRYVLQYPPASPLTTDDLDGIYALPYTGQAHPDYQSEGGVPGFKSVCNSIISHRGCCGGCHFCSLYLHQGRVVQSRSERSILAEIKKLASQRSFGGTVTDIGGPTANLYMAKCKRWNEKGGCRERRCMGTSVCPQLIRGFSQTIRLWREAMKIPGVKHLFVGSGVRHDILLYSDSDEYLEELCRSHISGRLKVAPEHCAKDVLRMMNKPFIDRYELFAERYDKMNDRIGKRQYLNHYFISAHPGSTLTDALELAVYLAKRRIRSDQIQDFIPLPMTISGCMYHTKVDPLSGHVVYVPRGERERKLHRALIQYHQPASRRYVLEALRKLGRMDLQKLLLG